MKLYITLILTLFISTITIANALTVPFQNIILNPNQSIQANFAIGNHVVIFCLSNDTSIVGNITWPYLNQTLSSSLPVFLTLDPARFQGQNVDPSGSLTITNNRGAVIAVSCLFGF